MHKLHTWFVIAVVAIAGLMVASCGSDDADVASSGVSGSTEATSEIDEEVTSEVNEESAENGEHDDEMEGTVEHEEPDEDGVTEDASSGDAVVVAVEMNDFGYELDTIEVPSGQQVRFEFTNVGAIEHEAMVGTLHEQEEFEEMDDHGAGHGEGGHHGEVEGITLDPGESGVLEVTIDEPGELMLGCHLPGHWDAGMQADLIAT